MSRATSRLASILSSLTPEINTSTRFAQSASTKTVKAAIRTVITTTKQKSTKMESSRSPLTGYYKPNPLQGLYYGPNTVRDHLLSCLPSETSKAFIVTGNSLSTKTPLIQELEELLGTSHHAGTFSKIKEHAPVAQLDEATEKVLADETIDTIISVGGGSPIDSSKAISYRVNEQTSKGFLRHISIPTTLSAAECTFMAGYTQSDGVKTGIAHPSVLASFVFYDPHFGLHTPPSLFLSTGIRALDHAVELQYHPTASLMPTQIIAQTAIRDLFTFLPRYKSNPHDEDTITRLFLAAHASLGFLGGNLKGGLGLSHTLGYALGSPYGIPHGITSCLTLGAVVKLKATTSRQAAENLAQCLPLLGHGRSRSSSSSSDSPSAEREKSTEEKTKQDALKLSTLITTLVTDLGLTTTLTEKNVSPDQIPLILNRATAGLSDKDDHDQTDDEKKLVDGVRDLVQALF